MKKVLFLVALLGTLIPAFFVVREAGGLDNWQGVVPKGTTDSLYYYARIKEVSDGHPLVGNPYIYEYRDTYSPAFFLPDIVSALPLLIGIPLDVAILFNVFVWSFVFLLLAFYLFNLLRMPKNWALVWSVLLYITSYSFMLRPTVMQLVYPLFVAFLIVLIQFLRESVVGKKREIAICLALVSAGTFYVYTYLSYIVVLSLAFVFLWLLITRRLQELKELLRVALYSGLILIPFGLYTWMQMSGPHYFETMTRIGLVYTRAPGAEAFLYGRWVAIALLALLLIKTKHKVFWFSTGLGLLASAFLNVFTGAELTLGVHIGRFIILWMAMVLGVLLYELYLLRPYSLRNYKIAGIALLVLALAFGAAKNLSRGLDFFKFDSRGTDRIADLQSYAGPSQWLEENVPEESVIWANRSLSQYIPIQTRHYPLFSHSAVLHSAGARELEDRYLLSQSLNALTIEDLKKDFGLYSGEKPLPDDKYFEELKERFENIKKEQDSNLEKFNAKYLLIDRKSDNHGASSLAAALYDDGRFVILPLPLR